MVAVLVLSLGLLAYVAVGYPALLWLLVRLRGERLVRRADITPRVSVVISAYNEAAVIGRKIENALALDYPGDRLEIVVVSDASDDGTDAIVERYADRGVHLWRQAERGGKTRGLNAVVPALTGDIVVFSDANAMYQPDALTKLVRNFADPSVGCVTGEAQYLAGDGAAADRGERVYWSYEIHIKRLETALGSMVGGDGAIYAIRRPLWTTLPDHAINDFLNPLQIVGAGWRGVYESDAICYEETAGRTRSEYRRRVRIVSRSWRAIFQAPEVLNPFRVGLFAWSVLSHKILRWLSGLFAGAAVLALGVLLWRTADSTGVTALVAMATVMILAMATVTGRRMLAMIGYFAAVNMASTVGVVKGSVGDVSGVWTTPRATAGPSRTQGPLVPVGPVFVAMGFAITGIVIAVIVTGTTAYPARLIFWLSLATLGYIYVGYPIVLAVWRALAPRPVRRLPAAGRAPADTPTACLFIAAFNEAAVLEEKLRNALALDYPADRLEIVVASDGSTDATNAIAGRFSPRVRLLALSPRRGKTTAINEGMRHITSEIVIFSDANTFLEPDAVSLMVQNFADPTVGAVSGDVALIGERAALGRSEDLYYQYERWLQRSESEVGSMIGADGALYAIRRDLFDAPDNDTILDDMAIPMAAVRAGRRVVFEPGARAHEQGSETAREEFARKSRVVAGSAQFLTRRDSSVPMRSVQVIVSLMSHKALRWLSPGFATAAFLSSTMLAGASQGYAAAAGAQGGLLALGLLGCVPRLRRIGPVAVAHYFCLVQAAALVGLFRGVSGRQSVLWRRFARIPERQAVEAKP